MTVSFKEKIEKRIRAGRIYTAKLFKADMKIVRGIYKFFAVIAKWGNDLVMGFVLITVKLTYEYQKR